MRDRTPTPGDSAGEAIRTVGLFLILTALPALAVSLGAIAGTSMAVTMGAAALALAAFCGGLACFAVDSRRHPEPGPLPVAEG